MARSSGGGVAVRVADAGTTGGDFEDGWTLEDSGGVRFGEGTGDDRAGGSDFVVARAKLSRALRPGLGATATSQYLSGLLAGTQTTPVDVEVRLLDKDGKPAGRGVLYRIVVPTSYSLGDLDAASKEALSETFEFVARDVEIVR